MLLHAIAEVAEDAVQRGLTHLQAAEFLYETRRFPDPEYTFKHALTHEVTYGTLLQDRRGPARPHRRGHRTLHPDRLTEHVERLAHHAVRGEVWEKAVTYLRQAGAKAFARSANREAVSVLRAGTDGPPASARDPRDAGAGHRSSLRSEHCTPSARRIRADLRLSPRSRGPGQDTRRSTATRPAVRLYVPQPLDDWSSDGSARVRPERQAIAESLGDVPLQVTGSLYLGAAYLWTGDYRRAEDLLLKVLQLLEGDRSRERFGLAGFPAVTARAI